MKLSLFFLFSSLIFPVFSWWEQGHMIVAQIALDNIDDFDVRLCAENIIGLWGNSYPDSAEFVSSSVWADDIKQQSMSLFNSWHYISIPIIQNNITPPQLPDENVVWAINGELSALRSSRNKDVGRALQLRLAIHFIGDIHNPMHSVTLYSNEFPNGDQGGNRFNIFYEDSRMNLHAFWDSGAGQYMETIPRPLTQEGKTYFENVAQHLQTEYPKSFFEGLIEDNSPMDWADQSHDLAVTYAYLNGDLQTNQNLTSEYIENARTIINQRLALGGYRLAYQLSKNLFLSEECLQPVTMPSTETTSTSQNDSENCKQNLSQGGIAGLAIATFIVGCTIPSIIFVGFVWAKKQKSEVYNPL